MQLIEVNCPVCQSTNYRVFSPDTLGENPPVLGYKWTPDILKRYRMVMCNICSHLYASPRLGNMYIHYKDVIDENYLANVNSRTMNAKRILPIIQRFAPRGRLLDVGCSTGDFISVAKDIYAVEGIELSRWASEITSKRGLVVRRMELNELVNSNQTYDVVTLWGVIEHMEYPREEMIRINRLLNDHGIVCLWTGDTDSIYFKILKHHWWYLMGQHIQLFSKKSMDRMMRDAGFQLIYRGIYPYTMSLEYLSILLSRYKLIGTMLKAFCRFLKIGKMQFSLRKSDEMFAIYKKTGHV
ncbi:MAG: hypothetical protein A3G33_05225 [Omnitrophica bacterium RIFCSPLOWO2_12_FULL_44_17]|uniref:Methyltransferase type 12 n=1 Tax=Candidatus Danuiimicrobium aquiferis TaxID=1801832 RepID=A0A1G1KQ68_9BACT|nr:MAG: hypothetical protein A3B72_04930 [Omnitrophica bacterium RIFCSPHIGHO2_02_FULL_45_28]OGW91253.1 MAG: hypothetical protein A3E74_04580 [Omnitrophica bacterium RIFCSPHIGHO2_12_FULL_44_12]OGW95036.1 MAG: hypothetical protein A3G33_05225 [Omnitrophica bacterium RIFCSPLOWO2_12_FULL_44_17]OGX02957.1 MAG: hypothetical protein A3J12_01445 [Omnitrophica bacterium RIFCSPLOWO2_02_FULL_44_11]